MVKKPADGPHGLLLVDKGRGPTSHDVVAQARRLLATRAVGHAGTLDPMATGLLVLLVGHATRLAPYLASDRKRYAATVCLGLGTTSFDADGTENARCTTDDLLRLELTPGGRLAEAFGRERRRQEQVPPSVSALHVGGVRAHERARRGETFELTPRPVDVDELRLVSIDAAGPFPLVSCELGVSKGYYVRAFARDLGAALGVPAHLTRLRRLASGPFTVDEAAPLERARAAALLPLSAVLRHTFACANLNDGGALRARHGKTLGPEHFESPPARGIAAWFYADRPVALGTFDGQTGRIERGFPPEGE